MTGDTGEDARSCLSLGEELQGKVARAKREVKPLVLVLVMPVPAPGGGAARAARWSPLAGVRRALLLSSKLDASRAADAGGDV